MKPKVVLKAFFVSKMSKKKVSTKNKPNQFSMQLINKIVQDREYKNIKMDKDTKFALNRVVSQFAIHLAQLYVLCLYLIIRNKLKK